MWIRLPTWPTHSVCNMEKKKNRPAITSRAVFSSHQKAPCKGGEHGAFCLTHPNTQHLRKSFAVLTYRILINKDQRHQFLMILVFRRHRILMSAGILHSYLTDKLSPVRVDMIDHITNLLALQKYNYFMKAKTIEQSVRNTVRPLNNRSFIHIPIPKCFDLGSHSGVVGWYTSMTSIIINSG